MTSDGNPARVDLYKRFTDTISALGALIAAVGILVAVWGYQKQEATGRLERTRSLLSPVYNGEDEAQRKEILAKFPDRWKNPIAATLSKEEATAFLNTCRKPEENVELCAKWNAARRHLNQLEPLAFAYVRDLGDSKILAAATCVYMSRSYQYFRELIEVFREEYGSGHSWQVIRQAVTEMEKRYGPQCQQLHAEIQAQQTELERR